MWASGYNLSDTSGVEDFIDIIQENLNWLNIVGIHLNNSKVQLKSRVDSHEDLSYGTIKEEGLKYFVKFLVDNDIPMVFETPCESETKQKQLAIVKSWI